MDLPKSLLPFISIFHRFPAGLLDYIQCPYTANYR